MYAQDLSLLLMRRIQVTYTLITCTNFRIHTLRNTIPQLCQTAKVIIHRRAVLLASCQRVSQLLESSSTFDGEPLLYDIPQFLGNFSSRDRGSYLWFNSLFNPPYKKMVISYPIFELWRSLFWFGNASIEEPKFLPRT